MEFKDKGKERILHGITRRVTEIEKRKGSPRNNTEDHRDREKKGWWDGDVVVGRANVQDYWCREGRL